jgi:hypothetical protein
MNIINNIKDLKKRIKVISENVFTSTANDDFKIKIINEDEFNQTLKKQYDLYKSIDYLNDNDYESNEDHDEILYDNYDRNEDEDINTRLSFDRFVEEQKRVMQWLSTKIVRNAIKNNLKGLKDYKRIIDIYCDFYVNSVAIYNSHYALMIVLEDENDQKWVIIQNAMFDSRDGQKTYCEAYGAMVEKIQRKIFTANDLPFRLKTWNHNLPKHGKELQDAVKKNFVDDFDDEEWEISRNILNSDKF